MKKTKRDLFFSFLSIFLIAFMMIAQLSSGLVVYAETFNDFGATPYNGNNPNGLPDNHNDLGRNGTGNSNNTDSGDISATNNDTSPSDGTTAPRGDNAKNNTAVWGWILAIVAVIIIVAIIAALSSKRRKR